LQVAIIWGDYALTAERVGMALSHHEQSEIRRIAAELDAGCYDFRWPNQQAQKPSRRQRVISAGLLVLGALIMTCAVLIPRRITAGMPVGTIAGYLIMLVAARLWCRPPFLRW